MRIVYKDGTDVQNPDFSLGRLTKNEILIAHHPAIEGVEEQWHYEIETEYPNGGADLKVVVDVPGVEAVDAWDEYEEVLIYTPYTDEELEAIQATRGPSTNDRLTELEEALSLILSRATE